MSKLDLDIRTIVKLVLWSTIVGATLYWLEWSTGEIFGWVFDKIATAWEWVAGTGLKYMLLGATIVVPVFVISRLTKKR